MAIDPGGYHPKSSRVAWQRYSAAPKQKSAGTSSCPRAPLQKWPKYFVQAHSETGMRTYSLLLKILLLLSDISQQTVRHIRTLNIPLMPLSDGTPAYIRIHFIFLARILIGLHFPANDIGLSSLKFFWWAFCLLQRGAFRPFKVIQGRWIWCQSKACMRLPISP